MNALLLGKLNGQEIAQFDTTLTVSVVSDEPCPETPRTSGSCVRCGAAATAGSSLCASCAQELEPVTTWLQKHPDGHVAQLFGGASC